MLTVSLKELKNQLSAWVSKAADGALIQVTRYNRPYVYISQADLPGLHVGSRAGKGRLQSAIAGGTDGQALEFLCQDRDE